MASIKGTKEDETLIGTVFNDKIDGKKGDDIIQGLDGNDKLKGGDGDDTFYGGKGNDSIDGGKGVDTAVYSGSIAQYTVTPVGTGNDKVIVADSVAGRDGTDDLKKVEYLQFADGVVDLQHGTSWHYLVDAEIDESAQKPGTEDMINGTGIPATHFGIARNEGAGVEIAFNVHHRAMLSILLPTRPCMRRRTPTVMPMVC